MMSPPIRLAAGLAVLAFAALNGSASADITLPIGAAATAQAIPRAVRIWRGGQVEIPLAGRHRDAGTLEFSIRGAPRHGHLSEVRSGGNDTATVTYTHDVTQPAGTDSFTYFAETVSGEKSQPAEVHIVIEEPPPRLQVPDDLDFGEMMAGKLVTRNLVIANEGGGIAEGKLRASSPWTLSADTFRVASGESQTVKVTFQAMSPKNYVGQVTVTGLLETVVSLQAKALAPLTVTPNPLRLQTSTSGDEVRSGSIAVTNHTDESMALKVTPTRYLKTVDTLEVPAHETRPIPVGAFRDYPPAIKEQIEIAAPQFIVRVDVEAEGLPPKVVLSGPATVEMADSAPGEARSAKLSLRNEGGRESAIRLQAREPFRAAPAAVSADGLHKGFRTDGHAIFLPPGQEADVEVRFSTDIPGQYATLLTIEADGLKTEVPLSAQVIAPPPAKVTEISRTPTPILPASRAAPTPVAQPAFDATGGGDLAQIESRSISRTEVELKWKRPSDPPFGYRIEMRNLALDANDEMKESWEQLRDARMTESGKNIFARIRSLNAATVYGFRVSAIDRQGSTTMESPAVGVMTSGEASRPWGRRLLLTALFASLIAIFFWQWRLSHA